MVILSDMHVRFEMLVCLHLLPLATQLFLCAGIWVQCILTINMFLEKLFLIEWLWLLIMLVVTIISFSAWCYKVFAQFTGFIFSYGL